MRYFNLNIRHEVFASQEDNAPALSKKKSAAEYWLEEKKMAPIFFGEGRLDSYRAGEFGEWVKPPSKPGVSKFIEVGDCGPEAQRLVQFVTIDDGYVWVYRPIKKIKEDDPIEFRRRKGKVLEDVIDIPKVIPVEHIRKVAIAEVPLVLSSMKVNQAFSRGTFREIDRDKKGAYLGNIAAIQHVTGNWEETFEVDPLDCLSSLEFETLIAKIFEECGCFVPAYKGGFLKDFDLIVKLDQNTNPSIGNVHLKHGVPFCIQLKLRFDQSPELEQWIRSGDGSHIAISLDQDHELDSLFSDASIRQCVKGRSWIREVLVKLLKTKKWLNQSLHWLPESRRIKF
jgi:hypothetical protein